MESKLILSALIGIAVGDALGVPVEFTSRHSRKLDPVTDMRGFGTYNQPPGTWSDDSSLTFCLAEALINGELNLMLLSKYFKNWLFKGFWTPHGVVFDVGRTTRISLNKLSNVESPVLAGCINEESNGNGSLMRVLPLVFYIKNRPIAERFDITKKVSSITHGHIRSIISCFYYLEYARELMLTFDKFKAYKNVQTGVLNYLETLSISPSEIICLKRLLQQNIFELEEDDIQSSGYVIDTLEASIWCLLKSNNFSEAVLKAVNLGEDTDTTGAVTGGLAGLLYGLNDIPEDWINQIARINDINKLAVNLANKFIN